MNLVEIPTGIVYWDLSTPYVTRPCMFKKKKKKKKLLLHSGTREEKAKRILVRMNSDFWILNSNYDVLIIMI